ncbi:MAG: YCF48-related protein [Ignavibacteriaceae bacterium]|nr:YCF48-related protein [Ignavibacteriaceae bacterium]
MESVYFAESNTGWIVGRDGTILMTSNGGNDWINQISGTSVDLYSVHFGDNDNGWAVGEAGTILMTSNGGDDWNHQISGISETLNSIFYIDINRGWTVGDDGTILHTANGGEDWSPQNSGTTLFLRDVFFKDTLNGWIVGNNTILRTTDGGNNWISVPTNETCFSVYFTDVSNGWIVGSGKIQHSTNGGNSWHHQIVTDFSYLNSIYFTDKNTGWVVGDRQAIFKTTTGGVSFVEEEQQPDEIPINYSVSQNFPNPFNPTTKIKFSIPQSSNIVIKVFDILGSEIETLVNEEKSAGIYEITWYAENLPSGVYFYQLKAGKFISTKKMVLMK